MPGRRTEAKRLRDLRSYLRSPVDVLGTRQETHPDSTLTALLQLITWRLSKQRAIVSLVDEDHQFFIAESTRTGDLVDETKYENDGDQVWMGCTGSTTRGEALCTNTIIAEPVAGGFSSFIVTDLRSDQRFHDLPYVRASPHFRYYAGTPLISKSGFRIGSLFVIDDRVLPTLTEAEIQFLGVMATNVMRHLEMEKEHLESQRQVKMSRGLAAFVEGKSSMISPVHSSHATTKIASHALPEYEDGSDITKDVFAKASNILRESLELDEVVFVDMKLQSHNEEAFPRLEITGRSYSQRSSTKDKLLDLSTIANEDLLARLQLQYTQGTIWAFYEDGTSESDSTESTISASDLNFSTNTADTNSQIAKAEIVARCFPGCRQIIYCPLWDSGGQSQSACFLVSSQQTPVFALEVEVPFVRAFINSVGAVSGQLMAVLGEQQKSSFISSMSHELRTPLHGILASTELLSETPLNFVQKDLCRTVEVCGTTLLDTISQVLDYSKLNKFLSGSFTSKGALGTPSSRRMSEQAVTHAGSSLYLESTCDLASLVEEAIGVIVLAYRHAGSSKTPLVSPQLEFGDHGEIVDINRQVLVDFNVSNEDWGFVCSPGAIRRIVLNLVSNSLKHTQAGSISVRLALSDLVGGQDMQGSNITLTVSDTGRGMSEEFLKNKLFVPFSQESSLVAGSGLGLSLVQGIIKSLNGKINVSSTLSEGTKIELQFALQRPLNSSQVNVKPELRIDMVEVLATWGTNRTVGIFGAGLHAQLQIVESLQHYTEGWWGLGSASPEISDIVFLHESNLEEFVLFDEARRSLHLAIVLFVSAPVADICQMYSRGWRLTETLTVPFGPQKLSQALKRGLDRILQWTEPKLPELELEALPADSKKQSQSLRQPSKSLRTAADLTNRRTFSDVAGQIRLPEARPLAVRNRATVNTDGSRTASDFRHLHVLCVDDNNINLKLLHTYVKKLGMENIQVASNGLEAIEAAKTHKRGFDVIFMDLTMPVCDGFEATRAIRLLEQQRTEDPAIFQDQVRATIIALTGLASDADQKKAFLAGIDHFVTKPLRFKDLKALLEAWHIIPI